MHLLVLLQDKIPGRGDADAQAKRLVNMLQKKHYSATSLHPSWNKIRAREIKLYDFTIPEKIEDEVLADLLPYEGGQISKKVKKISEKNIVKRFLKKLGLEPIDRSKVTPNPKPKDFQKNGPAYTTILGKIKDKYTEKGKEKL